MFLTPIKLFLTPLSHKNYRHLYSVPKFQEGRIYGKSHVFAKDTNVLTKSLCISEYQSCVLSFRFVILTAQKK